MDIEDDADDGMRQLKECCDLFIKNMNFLYKFVFFFSKTDLFTKSVKFHLTSDLKKVPKTR